MASFSRDRDTNIGAAGARRTCLASPLPALRVEPTRRGGHTSARAASRPTTPFRARLQARMLTRVWTPCQQGRRL